MPDAWIESSRLNLHEYVVRADYRRVDVPKFQNMGRRDGE
jgi:hypothetical protein